MSARGFLRRGPAWAVLPVLLAAACGSPERAPTHPAPAQVSGKRPDIVLVSIDSLRADHLSCYGHARPTSPTIDRLAAEGVRFRTAVSTTSWTLPAHAALFTGLYDSTHGLIDNGYRLGDRIPTLAGTLRDAGYRTAGFYGGPYLHPAFGIARGFETYESCMTTLREDLPQEAVRSIAEGETNASHHDITGPRTVERVGAWLDGLDDRPFFLFVHLWDVHYDYIPPPGYAERFDPDYSGSLTGVGVMTNPAVNPDMPKRDLDHLLALYDGEIRFTDENLGKILDALARRGRLDSAIVVVTADHGEEFFEHGNKGHQRSLYEEVLRIPLVVRWPGHVEAGRVVSDQVRIVDVMPTLLSLAGVPLREEIAGRDLCPLLRGESLEEAPALSELLVNGKAKLHAARTSHWKVIAFRTPHWWQIGAQFFDLDRDPGEREILSPWSLSYYRASRTLRKLRRDAADLAGRIGETSVRVTEADPEVRERLRSLGYLEDGR